ncbi:MAG: cytochrome C biogenesis protein [Candidatus Magasanikbacteria bacterium CG10_big_fil_rev_8_21_14_0_10_47_10]|uniref:Cytochrome C biogenesis protein n=1 Tax=Candidatus Magasanikbacteria bacterium CG10_big_fil_rev_8_21_14_0_10_47_10 TaxID=1974652 RepID=A0A2H0TRL5_9BACT|nr:MAG: cytochrome C biogenesis protein [Candidatus Magasanikbacteria bacterium CG10_big_fil_rev_8_21_14_0_10_47_10]
MELSLIIPSFIAGILTFLVPCTLPLVPGYLGFISGVSLDDLRDPLKAPRVRRRIFLNGLLYVLGFSIVFIILGSLVSFAGALLGQYRLWLTRIGGALVIFFGLYMMHIVKLPVLSAEKHFLPARWLKPGHPTSSFLFGVAFAAGWTPCVGPVLGSILALAATTTTIWQGAFLLTIFSLGLAVPFLLIAAGIGSVAHRLTKLEKYLKWVSIVGGIFLVFVGVLLLTNRLAAWIGYSYQWLEFLNYDTLLEYL